MKIERQHTYERVILAIEVIGFAAIIAVTWLDEYLDVPHRFFGALPSPTRPQEFYFEATTGLLVAVAVITATLWVFRRLRELEGFVQVCAWCRKVNLDGEWITFEQYLKREHDLRSTHGICPTCRAEATRPAARAAR